MKGKIVGKMKYLVIFVLIIVLVAILSPSYISAGTADQVQTFVTRFYVHCLGRQSDQTGLNQWVTSLLDGSKTGEDVAKGFILSPEFTGQNHSNEAFLTILYKAFFDRNPDADGYNHWLSCLNKGESRESILSGFLRSQEFSALCNGYAIKPYAGAPTTTTTTVASSGSISGTASGFNSGNAVNFILWGDDSASDRPGGRVCGRTDTNILVHINLDTHKAYVVTIPRDTWFNGRKINGYHASKGHDGAVTAFEQFTGIKIDFYVITDFDGFVPLINYFGGVTTNVEENIADGFSGCYLNVGTHAINGTQALALCRARKGRSLYGGGAYARERQAAMLMVDLMEQKKSMVNSGNLASFLNDMSKYVWSNISLSQAARILPVLLSMNRNDITITTFDSWPQWFGKSSAVGYNEAAKNQFFCNIANQ